MTATVNVSATANAPKSVLWEILADFPNIADYTDSVRSSESTGEQDTGVGASRYCQLAPIGSTEETILEFVPEERLVVSLYNTTRIPVKKSRTTFSLEAVGDNATKLTMNAEVEAKGGPLARLVEKRLARALPKGALSLVNDLAAAAESVAAGTGPDSA